MAGKKKSWEAGDCFAIPLNDGTFSVGQVISAAPEALNSVVCALFARRYDDLPSRLEPALIKKELVSVLFVTRDLLDRGSWPVFSREMPFPVSKYLNMDDLRKKGFVGARIIGSAIVTEFMNAYYGLCPWNGFHKPDYLDQLLISADRKPSRVLLA